MGRGLSAIIRAFRPSSIIKVNRQHEPASFCTPAPHSGAQGLAHRCLRGTSRSGLPEPQVLWAVPPPAPHSISMLSRSISPPHQ